MINSTVALPPKVRAILYIVVFFLGLFVIVGTAVFGAIGTSGWPVWFKGFAAGEAAFASALGLTAASNTKTGTQDTVDGPPAGEGEQLELEPFPEHAVTDEVGIPVMFPDDTTGEPALVPDDGPEPLEEKRADG